MLIIMILIPIHYMEKMEILVKYDFLKPQQQIFTAK